MPDPTPTMGRKVFVKFDTSMVVGEVAKIVERPADVIVVHPDGRINVVAKLDGPHDTPAEFQRYGAPPSTRWIGNVPYDPTGAKVPCWRWPPRV